MIKKLNLDTIRLENETEEFLLLKTKTCETFIKQIQREAEETLDFRLSQPRKAFSITPSINLSLDSK